MNAVKETVLLVGIIICLQLSVAAPIGEHSEKKDMHEYESKFPDNDESNGMASSMSSTLKTSDSDSNKTKQPKGEVATDAPDLPMMLNNRLYFWATRYYKEKFWQKKGYTLCAKTLTRNSSDKHSFPNAFFGNGFRPRRIAWNCRIGTEKCCGFKCCTVYVKEASITHFILILFGIIALMLLVAGSCCILYHCILKLLFRIRSPTNSTINLNKALTKPGSVGLPANKDQKTKYHDHKWKNGGHEETVHDKLIPL